MLISKRDLERKLKAAGCYYVRPGGNHEIWYSPITGKNFPVSHGGIKKSKIVLNRIEKQSGVTLKP